jgi:sugar-specific transcriptional regulator TrmB
MKTKIENYLAKFPKDATSWAGATDEIRDMSRESREFLEDLDEVTVEPVDFKACKTPVEWNTKGRESIIANFDRMTASTQRSFFH